MDQALTLYPAIVRTTIDNPNAPSTAVFYLKNTTSQTIELTAAALTLDRYDPIGRPLLNTLNFHPAATNPSINLNPGSTILFPQETAGITATIHPQFLHPGSNYALISFRQIHPQTDATHNIVPAIAGLLQIRNPAGEIRQLVITGTNLPQITTRIPTQITIDFENQGNADIIPYGDAYAHSFLGKNLEFGYLNQDSHIIYPQTKSSLPLTIDQSLKPKPIDILDINISGHDELNTVTFQHSDRIIFLSPLLLTSLALSLIFTLIILISRRLGVTIRHSK